MQVVRGVDIMVVRELTGDVYFGEPKGITQKVRGYLCVCWCVYVYVCVYLCMYYLFIYVYKVGVCTNFGVH